MKLSETQKAYLRLSASAPIHISEKSYGHSIVCMLRLAGQGFLAISPDGDFIITEAGRAALSQQQEGKDR